MLVLGQVDVQELEFHELIGPVIVRPASVQRRLADVDARNGALADFVEDDASVAQPRRDDVVQNRARLDVDAVHRDDLLVQHLEREVQQPQPVRVDLEDLVVAHQPRGERPLHAAPLAVQTLRRRLRAHKHRLLLRRHEEQRPLVVDGPHVEVALPRRLSDGAGGDTPLEHVEEPVVALAGAHHELLRPVVPLADREVVHRPERVHIIECCHNDPVIRPVVFLFSFRTFCRWSK